MRRGGRSAPFSAAARLRRAGRRDGVVPGRHFVVWRRKLSLPVLAATSLSATIMAVPLIPFHNPPCRGWGHWATHRSMAAGRRRRGPSALFVVAVLLALPGQRTLAQEAVALSCQDAAAAAEKQWDIPGKLLSAIGIRESGRVSGAGRAVSWPWAINAEGKGFFAANKRAAVAQVQALQASGMQSIDVGCFQINLAAHPLAFSSLEIAFDPMANGAYAGQFLASLHNRTGNWLAAVAAYHSSTAPLGEAYRQQVFAEWLGPTNNGFWPPAATMPPPPGTVRLAGFRSMVAVWSPAGRLDIAPVSVRPALRSYGALPRVITPAARP